VDKYGALGRLKSMVNNPEEAAIGSPDQAIDLDRRALFMNERTNIWRAAATSDLAAIEEFLQLGASVNEVEGNQLRTPLFSAVMSDQPEAAAFLISRGADVNIQDLYGDTPLMYAAMSGNRRITSLLLENGADVTAKDLSKPPKTAAEKARQEGQKEIVELLEGPIRRR
jgi:ankyrin repeat protein